MVTKAKYVPVKLTYNQNGKTYTREILTERGMKLAFDGATKAEQGKYTVGNDGYVYDEKGKKIGSIQTTVDQVAALEGMSKAVEEEGTNEHTFILSDADINASMDDNGGERSSRNVNMRSNALGASRKTHYKDGQWDTHANMMSGVYSTRMTAESKNPSTVSVSSSRTEAQGRKNKEDLWKHQHPIKNWINEITGLNIFKP